MATGRSARILENKLNDFEDKLRAVVQAQKKTAWEINELKRENKQLKQEKELYINDIKEWKRKYSVLQKDFNKSKNFAKIVTDKLTPTGGVSELRDSVDRYIREIDKCIKTLQETI